MEHRKKGRKLKRTTSHKKALLSNLATSLIKNKRIKTTVAKAKELRTFIEPLITKAKKALLAKNGSPESAVHYFRLIKRFIKDKEASNLLMGEVAEKVKERNGGYTRILKTGFRLGDGAEEAIIELVDFAVASEKSEGTKKKTTRKTKTTKTPEEVKPDAAEAASETEEKPVKKPRRKKTESDKTEKPKKSTTSAKKSKEEPEKKKTTRKSKPKSEE